MNIVKNIITGFLIVVISLLFIKCKDENPSTGISEVDNEYKFINKDVFKVDKDPIYTYVELFYNKTLDDSVYTIGIKPMNGYKIRAHGWGVKEGRIGNWYYEKVYDNQKVVIDSIVNYVIYCEENPINTIKKFKNNVLDKSKGYFHEINMKKNIFVNDTLDIKIDFTYDTVAFDKIGREFYMFRLFSNDYCDASNFVIDSFPVINKSTKMKFLVENKGKRKLLGYYFLRKKNKDDSEPKALQIFTEINYEVK